MNVLGLKLITWVGSSLEDMKNLPKAVQREFGFSLHQTQEGKKPSHAKPLRGLKGGIFEIVSTYNKNAYRAVYAVKLGNDIYVLHVFQKKSKAGIKTPKEDLDLIRQRLIVAKQHAKK